METVDVVIVGSGFGGSIPALRLAQSGRSVVVLEQGPRLTEKDFVPSWSFREQSRLFTTYQSQDYSVFFRYGRGVGGGSLTYAAAMLRAPSEVFAYRDGDDYHVWPASVTRAALDPHYAEVERMMSVSRIPWDEVPRAGAVFAMLLDKMGLTCDRARYPMVDCLGCGFCMAGCPYGRKQHLGRNYVPQAETAGAEFRAGCKVERLSRDGSGYVVHYRDHSGLAQTVAADLVLLAAGALETPAVLLRSGAGLGELHPEIGKNLNNNGDMALIFQLPPDFPDAQMFMGRNNAGMITYAFWEEHKITIHAGAGPPALFAALDVVRDDGEAPRAPLGLEFKRFMRDNYPNRLVSSLAIGLVDSVGRVTVDGQGLVHFDFPMTPALSAYIERVAGVGRRIAEATGAKLCRTADSGWEHADAHPLGTVRMGDDDAKAPCTPAGELRGFPGLYVTDGAAIPGGTGVNPANTIAANAERIAAGIVAGG